MNSQSFALAERLIPATYLQQAATSKKLRENQIKNFIEQRKWPEEGWDDPTIELFLNDLAQMDTNNFPTVACVGEREARFASSLVARRHYRIGHGIGRSGDIGEVQPKAVGSSLLIKLTNSILLDTIRLMGVTNSAGCFMIPMATGMSLVLCMLAMKQERPGAKFVLWSRIDQKSCFKCILTAGLQPIILETNPSGDELKTDLVNMEAQLATLGSDNIVCVLTTTSCFAPRASDSLEQVAGLCHRYNVPHLVNNSYGLQSARIMHLIQDAARKGRLDVFVSSTDKNFLVPVGGTLVSGFNKSLLERIAKSYPGRASASPVMDIFITLLSLGVNGYKNLLTQRKEMYKYLKEEMNKVAAKHGEKLLDTKNNPISIAMTLNSLVSAPAANGDNKRVTVLGSMLFVRCVSGTRVVSTVEQKELSGYKFEGWGAHTSNYGQPYLTAAATLGIRKEDVDVFVEKLDKAINKFKGKSTPGTPSSLEELNSLSSSRRGGAILRSVGGSGGGDSRGGLVNGGDSSIGEQASTASNSLASSKDSLRK